MRFWGKLSQLDETTLTETTLTVIEDETNIDLHSDGLNATVRVSGTVKCRCVRAECRRVGGQRYSVGERLLMNGVSVCVCPCVSFRSEQHSMI